jgi:glycosyltransferase involved in cell wall biosynthesis
MIVPDLFVFGPPDHGVVRYAHEVAQGVSESFQRRGRLAEPPPRRVDSRDEVVRGHPLHVHFTDRIFGSSPDRAAASFEAIASLAPVSVTLHDIPQGSDGAASLLLRRECYRRVVSSARGVVCNSFHEVSLLRELDILGPGPDPMVIPLAASPPVIEPIVPSGFDPVVALVGWVYPGKGHREVIDSLANVRGGVGVIALGSASVGHESDLSTLTLHAESLGVPFRATGRLSDEELRLWCRRVAVPIAAHQHISASASILTWLGAGRRPLVVDSRYTREMLELRPGTMTLFDPGHMDAAISSALADPASTVLDPDIDTAPNLVDTVDAYVGWWSTISW